MNKAKKIVLPAILLLVLIGGVYAANNQQVLSAISGIKAGNPPVITNGFLDKTKYVIGDQMLITASAEDSKGIREVKAEIENENGIDTVKLNLIGGDDKKGTWQAVWTVHDVTGKKIYETKVVAINSEERQSEFALYWIDPAPNPGHTAGEIGGTTDGERTFNSAGLYTFPGQIKIQGGAPGANKVLTSNASGLASWETQSIANIFCSETNVTDDSGMGYAIAYCPDTTYRVMSGGCTCSDTASKVAMVVNRGNYVMPGGKDNWWCGCVSATGSGTLTANARIFCCK